MRNWQSALNCFHYHFPRLSLRILFFFTMSSFLSQIKSGNYASSLQTSPWNTDNCAYSTRTNRSRLKYSRSKEIANSSSNSGHFDMLSQSRYFVCCYYLLICKCFLLSLTCIIESLSLSKTKDHFRKWDVQLLKCLWQFKMGVIYWCEAITNNTYMHAMSKIAKLTKFWIIKEYFEFWYIIGR